MSLGDLTQELSRLSTLVYGDHVKTAVEALITQIPPAEECKEASTKVQLYVLRGKARLLLPSFSKEAEQDLNRALKLNPNCVDAWVALSECYWRRNSITEARDALESSLQVSPKHQGTLAQLSRILRASCALEGVSNDDKIKLLEQSIERAHEAVSVDPTSADAWSAYGIAILQQTVAFGMDLHALKKALQALTQAIHKDDKNPDCFYNRAVIFRSFGQFAASYNDFMKAFHLDPAGLKGAKKEADVCLQIVKSAAEKTAHFSQLPERDFKRLILAKFPDPPPPACNLSKAIGRDEKQGMCLVPCKVMDLLCHPSAQPLSYFVVDKEGAGAIVLVYRLMPTAIKLGDVLWIPVPPSSISSVSHNFEGIKDESGNFVTTTIIAETSSLMINGVPVPSTQYRMPSLAVRHFQ